MKLYTLAEAGALIGRSPITLRSQIRNGVLRGKRLGNTWVVTERELQRYVREHRRPD